MHFDRDDVKDVILVGLWVIFVFAAIIGLFTAASYLFPAVFNDYHCCCGG
jgi:hypothetical protein